MSRYPIKAQVKVIWTHGDEERRIVTFEGKPIPLIVLSANKFFFIHIARHIYRNLGYPGSIDFDHFIAAIDDISDEVFEIKFSFPITLRSVRT
ncbi:hypothetical protein GW943_02565 [Candidatus Parcubacteria bacterium]|nr:hypothetical protein [Candidatus Parcubacteria bacterium]